MSDLIYNPETREALRLHQNKWVPTQVIQNDTGATMAFDGIDWKPVGNPPAPAADPANVAPPIDPAGQNLQWNQPGYPQSRPTQDNPPGPDYSGMPWPQVLENAVQNAPGSAVKFGGDIIRPITHPVETAESLYHLGKGLIQLAIPGEQGSEKYARAVGEFYIDRYGSIEGVKKAISQDPVSVLADVSLVLTGGGSAAARAPGMVGRIGKTVQTAGRLSNPVTMAAKGVQVAAKPVGYAARNLIGGLGTHTGPESLRHAYKAGRAGPGSKTSQTFRGNMDGGIPTTAVVEEAKSALARMRKTRSANYAKDIKNVKESKTIIGMDKIDDVINKTEDLGKFEGVTFKKSAVEAFDKIRAQVDEWRKLDPSVYRTPAGMDALKQAIHDIAEGYQWGTPARKAAMDVYHSIRQEIAAAAPAYDKAMRGYSQASDMIDDISRTLSANPKASVDTTLRKLQSVLRNNANTNYGRRAELVNELAKAGGSQILPAVAGQSLGPLTPRGLGPVVAGGNISAGIAQMAAGGIPWTWAALPFQSPRLMGEAAYAAGLAGKGYSKAGPTIERAALISALLNKDRNGNGNPGQ